MTGEHHIKSVKGQHAALRVLAQALATHFNVDPSRKVTQIADESLFRFEISLSMREFNCTVSLPGSALVFRAKHRCDLATMPKKGAFCVSLKVPISHMYSTTLLPDLSTELGVRTYIQPRSKRREIAKVLLASTVCTQLRKVPSEAVNDFILSPIRLNVKLTPVPVTQCVQQVEIFCELQRRLFGFVQNEACHSTGSLHLGETDCLKRRILRSTRTLNHLK
jgi:hypothetical protein